MGAFLVVGNSVGFESGVGRSRSRSMFCLRRLSLRKELDSGRSIREQ